MTRAEHLAWCKKRALEYVEIGDLSQALVSMTSDLSKHTETQNHPGCLLGAGLILGGHLDTPHSMRNWIEGFN